jgi:hypothetical protein
MNRYKVLGHISAGAHGVILKGTYANAIDKSSDISEKYLLAIKRIFIRNKTIPLSIVREIKCLQYLRSHENVRFFYFLIKLYISCDNQTLINAKYNYQ